MDVVRVMIVDDQAPFRTVAKMVVQMTPGFELVAEAETGESAVAMAAALDPALILMDINLPGINGMEAVRAIHDRAPNATAFLLSTYAVAELPAGARRCGAVAYIHKEDFGSVALQTLWQSHGDPAWAQPGAPRGDVTVMIVDDQKSFRDAARIVVQHTHGFELLAEVETGEAAVEHAAALLPDLILMDINLPGINGIEATQTIHDARPDTMAFLVSTYAVESLPDGARRCGAVAYVHKEDFTPALLRSLWESRGDPDWQRASNA
jgi:DNA-binding NarL/FixJ family response regulator